MEQLNDCLQLGCLAIHTSNAIATDGSSSLTVTASDLSRNRDGGKIQAQGLINASPQASKSRMFRVARAIARDRAIAAI